MMLNDETFEFSQARLRLNSSLRFTPRVVGENTTYLVEDEVTGRFFRLGVPQYTFLSMLDGKRTVSTALMKTATLLREHAIDEQEAASLCKWAIESGLVESETGNSADRRIEQHELQRKQRIMSWANPLMLRIPLFNPERIVEKLYRYLGFLISPAGMVVWLAVVAYGFLQLGANWSRFYNHQISSFSVDDIAWMAISWIVLKSVHESAHAVVCRRFGGRTHECGVLLLMMIPMPFVDLTSSWRFDNKWKRILTSAAGMMAELFIAAIACVIWIRSEPGQLQYHAGNLIISATVMTLLFNLNPLMRFDGYYMLADFLEIPNMSSHGRQWLKGINKRAFFGVKLTPLKETGYRGLCVRAYGVLATIWSVLVISGLSFAAYSFVDGFGLLIALSASVLWLGIPLLRLGHYVVVGGKFEQPNRLWFATALTLMVACVGAFLHFCPGPSVVSAPFVVDYDPHTIIRARAPGFVSELHVIQGQEVVENQLLATLKNPELRHELESLQIDIQISELRINSLFTEREVSQMQLQEESLTAMRTREKELRKYLANLEVRASSAGRVIGSDLDSAMGRWFEPGQDLLSIGAKTNLHAIALTKQADVRWIEDRRDHEATLLVWGRHENEMISGRIKHVRPRARDDVPHEAFSVTAGGPLAVVPRSQVEERSADDGSDTAQDLMLTEPRVPIEIEVPETERSQLYAGQSGQMLLRSRDENMWKYLRRKVYSIAREETHRTHGL